MNGGASSVRVFRLIARLNIGGPAVNTVLLTRGLNGGRFTSTLVTGVVGPGEGDMTGYARERGVDPVVIPELRANVSPWNDVRAFVKILRLLWTFRPHVVHTHTAKAGGLGRIAATLYNVCQRLVGAPRARLVHTFHGHLFHGYFPKWKSTLLVLVERVLGRLTDRIVTVSEDLGHELVNRYHICPASRLVVIPLGLDLDWTARLDAERGQLRKEFAIDIGDVVIGIVGRLTSIKNHDLFLRAAQSCQAPDTRFVVIGDGERRAALVALAETLDLDDRVLFSGWQSDRARIYADLDVACLTSLNEGTPLALIEAMAAGRPVVATQVGGVRNLMVGGGRRDPGGFEVFDNGILVPPNDAGALGAAVEYLSARPERRRAMGAVGRPFVEQRFSAQRLVAEMEQLYANLLHG